MNTEAPSNARRTSRLAIAAFVVSLFSCLCLPAPVAMLLGVLALMQLNADPTRKGKGLAIAALVIPIPSLLVVIMLGAVAFPSYQKYMVRAKQSECTTMLRVIATGEKSLQSEQMRYSEKLADIGFFPDREMFYAYLLSQDPVFTRTRVRSENATAVLADKNAYSEEDVMTVVPPFFAGNVRVGVEGECPACEFTAICVGNLDSDPAPDIWSISSRDRVGSDGAQIPALLPFHEVDDLVEN